MLCFQLKIMTSFLVNDAPPQFVHTVYEWNRNFPGKLTGGQGSVAWLSRSPSLILMDFYFWGYVKKNDLSGIAENQNQRAVKHVTPEMLDQVCQGLDYCLSTQIGLMSP
jgi:hypothetical protein